MFFCSTYDDHRELHVLPRPFPPRRSSDLPLAVMLSLLLASAALAQEQREGSAPGEKLGTVSFATSCSATAQPLFNRAVARSEEHTSELQSLMRRSYALF